MHFALLAHITPSTCKPSVAYEILNVVLIDARQLCAGATGRNGGHIKTMTFAMWAERKKIFGIEETFWISLFEDCHLEAMHSAMLEDGIDASLVLTEGIEAYYKQKTLDQACESTQRDEYLKNEFKLSSRCVGAICEPSASVWPYRWITGVLGHLVYPKKLNVQTNTIVTSILDDSSSQYATVCTNRGNIRARNVIHAGNAWASHLNPELRPFISPVRVNVVDFDSSSNDKADQSTCDYDYLIQRNDGDLVIGRACTGRKDTPDDSTADIAPMQHLRGFAEEALASVPIGSSTRIDHQWSGIVAFTQDDVPFAGRLPFSGYKHQWVCGAFHATGMIKASRTSQAVAAMILGDQSNNDIPSSFLVITEERVRGLKRSVEVGGYPIHAHKAISASL
ncbi:uncharacterized protein N7469_004180 [Penicillium citrinum]|uniref:FAD dependent oxidoreductase domain-containing protein n=1 Tax=Penicillium citrinum TaxID=5077 RepID=A0A9W9TQJ4_PENCI|nr:uncharacterized protein N7469_004180 [Penicillium citrinum]KAJ5235012.1 hypothetical protein N7469_004180 [Penicillium citrinum]